MSEGGWRWGGLRRTARAVPKVGQIDGERCGTRSRGGQALEPGPELGSVLAWGPRGTKNNNIRQNKKLFASADVVTCLSRCSGQLLSSKSAWVKRFREQLIFLPWLALRSLIAVFENRSEVRHCFVIGHASVGILIVSSRQW